MNGNRDVARLADNAWLVLAGRIALAVTPVTISILGTLTLVYMNGLSEGLKEIKQDLSMVQSDVRNVNTIWRHSTHPRLNTLERRIDSCCRRGYTRRDIDKEHQ